MTEQQHGPERIEEWLTAVADGRVDRDTADRWAARRVLDEELSWDEASWRALQQLHGIDLRHGPGEPYLHDAEQVREWAAQLRQRRAVRR
ncbi:hypothetical protein [Streptomyces sp. TLI_171]|uniref:hypothetical protein n=1 Tax=Streptomyces sp. TLI_171 TaxID=1938859 RepID=UPI000C19A12F|nr:hypothetical protein [Streptomyces sp. TLI_171]RKE22973.1 hypothetical protein BX266_6429 [Streptomyces sp. TLI_171]